MTITIDPTFLDRDGGDRRYALIYSLGVNRGNTKEHEGRTRHLE
jgi:hypothetical protein